MQKQQAMMAEYAKYGVSPLSGCMRMLIQMPIWIAMFNFVPNAIQLRGESFLWMQDLSTFDPIFEWGSNLWLIGDHLSLTCILFCGAQILYSWFTMQQQKDQMVGQQADQMKAGVVQQIPAQILQTAEGEAPEVVVGVFCAGPAAPKALIAEDQTLKAPDPQKLIKPLLQPVGAAQGAFCTDFFHRCPPASGRSCAGAAAAAPAGFDKHMGCVTYRKILHQCANLDNSDFLFPCEIY